MCQVLCTYDNLLVPNLNQVVARTLFKMSALNHYLFAECVSQVLLPNKYS